MGEKTHRKWVVHTETDSQKGAIKWQQTEDDLILSVAQGLKGLEYFRGQIGADKAAKVATETVQEVAQKKEKQTAEELAAVKEEVSKKIVERWKKEIKQHFHNHLFTSDETAQLMLTKLAEEKGEQYSKQVKYSYFTAYRTRLLTIWVTEEFILYLRLGSGEIIFLGNDGEIKLPFTEGESESAFPQNEFDFSRQDLTEVKPDLIFFSGLGTPISAPKAGEFDRQVRDEFASKGLDYLEENLDKILSLVFPPGKVANIPRGVFCRADLVKEELGARLVAAIKNNKSISEIKRLIKLGAPIDYTDLAGRSPLMLVLCSYSESPRRENLELIDLLLKQGADVNREDNLGWTPLLLAARNCAAPQVVKRLVAAGADVQKRHTMGELALDFAGRNENLVSTEAYELLRQKTYQKK